MRGLRAHDQDKGCGLVCFNEVVGRDPFFIVGRGFGEGFSLPDLAGKRIGVVSEVPTPWLCLRQDLRDLKVDTNTIHVVTGKSMAENRADLAAGTIDAFQTFQPFAEWAINDGGKLLYAAANRGPTAYTSFYTTATLIDRNRDSFRAMSVACQKSVGAVLDEGGAVVFAFSPTSSFDVTASLSSVQSGQDLDIYVLDNDGNGVDPNQKRDEAGPSRGSDPKPHRYHRLVHRGSPMPLKASTGFPPEPDSHPVRCRG